MMIKTKKIPKVNRKLNKKFFYSKIRTKSHQENLII